MQDDVGLDAQVDALAGRQRTNDAVILHFTAKPGVAEWIADLSRREAACCPFMSHHVDFENDVVTWRASSQAGPEAQELLDEFYALPNPSPSLLGKINAACGC